LRNDALNPETRPDAPPETHLEFSDNRLLVGLCGEHDRNLARIEDSLGIQIVRRGNRLAVLGEDGLRERASEVLRALYRRLESGKELDLGDIVGEIRMGGSLDDVPPPVGGQLEMFRGGRIEIRTRRKTVEPRSDAQKAYARALMKNELAFGIGPAGTGKTYLAVAMAVHMFIEGHVDRIVLSRPALEAGERLGFLPGDMKDKVDPYMQPLYDALYDFLPGKHAARLIEDKRVEIAPLAFMRGRTLSNAFVVLDEAQNATVMQMKMFLTRLGEGSRMAITGDLTQADLPYGVQSGLRDAERLLKHIDGVSFNYFTARDVVRHHLVARIVRAYGADRG